MTAAKRGKKKPATGNDWSDLVAPESAPAKPAPATRRTHDWDALYHLVDAESRDTRPQVCVWDELYVHAIEKALVGHEPADLLRMLDAGLLLHPVLLPALADVIRGQRRGSPKKLTEYQDRRMIRDLFDRIGPNLYRENHPTATIKWLAKEFGVSVDTIRRSLKNTEPPPQK